MGHLKKKFLFLLIIVIMGIVTGFLFSNILSNDDKKIVYQEITNFFNNIINDVPINYGSNFLFSIKNNFLYLIIIIVFGLSVIGLILNNFILFFKSFLLGFILGSIINIYLYSGIVLGIVYVFPFMIINIFAYALIISYANLFSLKLFNVLFKKKEYNFHSLLKTYFKVSLFCLVILIISSLYETFITPFVIRLFSFLIK